ncbi:hypothetical protein JTB14_034147 [Gonioctena quinquepunctata]|nr:hypothetical protein JTB14_034147 [Gonioctena quinquepunctata]
MFQNKDVIKVCEVLAEQENLKVTLVGATKGALMTGLGALSGGLLGGPVGLAIGGTLSSIIAAWYSRGQYRPVIDILRNDLTPQQKNRLINAVNNVLNSIKPEDCITLLTFVLTNASLKEAVLVEIGNFLLREMSLKMIK